MHSVATHRKKGFLILISIAAGMAGMLYGYDTSCISGAIVFLKENYNLSATSQGAIISAIMIGGVLGVAFCGFLSDRYGRRKVLLWGAITFFFSALISAFTQTPSQLFWMRVIGGVGIGLASSLATTYISEVAPPKHRGTLSSLYQLLTGIGITATFIINYLIARFSTHIWAVSHAWRWMLGIGAIPALLFFLAMLFSPESPRFLIEKARSLSGYNTLVKVSGPDIAKQQMKEIKAAINRDSHANFKALFKPGLRRALYIGLFLAFMNQFAGVNVVMYYGPSIFKGVGMSGNSANFLASAGIGVVALLATIVAMFLIDNAGRRKMLELSATLLVITSCLVAYGFASHDNILLVVCVLLFVISYAVGMGPVPWVMIPELFPTYLRARAAALCTVLMWACNWAIGQFTPMMLNSWGGCNTFIFFALMNFAIGLGVYFFVPETKGKSLEQIEDAFWPKGMKKETSYKN